MEHWVLLGLLLSLVRLGRQNNIKLDHTDNNGINWYTWTWNSKAKDLGVDTPEFGVIAQEVLEIVPEDVKMAEDGYYSVDYSILRGF